MNEFMLHKHRNIGEKMNLTFSYIREHQSLLFKSTWILSLPLVLLLTFYSTLNTIPKYGLFEYDSCKTFSFFIISCNSLCFDTEKYK